MKLITNNSTDAAYNQAFEETAFALETHEPLLLLWRNRPAVICGRFQNLYQEAHVPTLARLGVQPVRRMTGGGCVYHDLGNVNYTIITDTEQAGYEEVLALVIAALNRVGIPAERGRESAIQIGGYKISGSAQRLWRGRLLHHGTLLYDSDLTALRKLANGHSACYASKAIRSEPAPVINIRTVTDLGAVENFMNRLIEAFEPDDTVPPDQHFCESAERLANEKYRDWTWTFAGSPKFDFMRICEMDGYPLTVAYRAEKAVIRDMRIETDLFKAETLSNSLEGMPLNPERIREVLKTIIFDAEKREYLLDCIF